MALVELFYLPWTHVMIFKLRVDYLRGHAEHLPPSVFASEHLGEKAQGEWVRVHL